jgi:hypothetical protein
VALLSLALNLLLTGPFILIVKALLTAPVPAQVTEETPDRLPEEETVRPGAATHWHS